VEVLETTTGKLLAALRKLTNEIRRVIDDRLPGDGEQVTAALSTAQLKKLRSALIDMDIAVVNELMLECVGCSPGSKTKRELSEIERFILLFEYDAAIDRIDLLIDAMPKE
jgi:hypothetical protein